MKKMKMSFVKSNYIRKNVPSKVIPQRKVLSTSINLKSMFSNIKTNGVKSCSSCSGTR
jgi:hypothetical protein